MAHIMRDLRHRANLLSSSAGRFRAKFAGGDCVQKGEKVAYVADRGRNRHRPKIIGQVIAQRQRPPVTECATAALRPRLRRSTSPTSALPMPQYNQLLPIIIVRTFLIAHAGTIHRAPLADWTSEAWDEGSHHQHQGLLFLSSTSSTSDAPPKTWANYFYNVDRGYFWKKLRARLCGVKSGLAGLTRSLAAELGVHEITCNAISPGGSRATSQRLS